jgi:hypothetical protein
MTTRGNEILRFFCSFQRRVNNGLNKWTSPSRCQGLINPEKYGSIQLNYPPSKKDGSLELDLNRPIHRPLAFKPFPTKNFSLSTKMLKYNCSGILQQL